MRGQRPFVPLALAAMALFTIKSVCGLAQERGENPQKIPRGQEALRGVEKKDIGRMIEKKDIRLVILYDEEETPSGQAAELARSATVDAIASGAKVTKADAARQMPGKPPAGHLGQEGLKELFPPNSSVVFFAAKQIGGGVSPRDCPPADCGCDKVPVECICLVWRNHDLINCMCRMCPLGMGSATGKASRLSAEKPTMVLVIGEKLQHKLGDPRWWERNREWFDEEVWQKVQASPTTTNLTIKTKSGPSDWH